MARRPATATTRRPEAGEIYSDQPDVTTMAEAHRRRGPAAS